MQPVWNKDFGQKSDSEIAMDAYLASQGLYRMLTARDASCLFRAVSEQMFSCQSHHREVRKACVSFMRENRENFQAYVEGSFEEYLERLGDPEGRAGQLEISALSLMYNRDFILYQEPGQPPTCATNNGFEDKILLCCSDDSHYDSVYTEQSQADAAVCQAVLYEILYKDMLGVEKKELRGAVDSFRSGDKKNRNSASVGSEDANFDSLPKEGSNTSSERREEDWEGNNTDNPPEDKLRQGTEEAKQPENPQKICFAYRVMKALDPRIYRNIEFEVWLDSRRELRKTDYFMFAGRKYYVGDRCQVCLEPGGEYYSAYIQDVGPDDTTMLVFIEELAEKYIVPLANFRPVTQVTPDPACDWVPSQRGGNNEKITRSPWESQRMGMKSWKKPFRRVRGKEAYTTMAYNRSQTVLPPWHNVPSGHPSPFNYSQTSGNTASYGHYRPPRRGRGYRMPRGSAQFTKRNNMVGPQVPLYPDPGKRCYHSYGIFFYVSQLYSHSHQQLQNFHQAGPHVPQTGEEPQALEETVTSNETERGDESAFPAVPVSHELEVHVEMFVKRKSQYKCAMLKEFHKEYMYTPSDPNCGTPTVFSSAGTTANLVMEKSAEISTSSCVNDAPATVFSSSVATDTQDYVITPIPPQPAVQPILESPSSAGRPVVISPVPSPYYPAPPPIVSEVGDSGSIAVPYSYNPNCSDLPQDAKVVQYYFNLGLQYYHQSYWRSMEYRQQAPVPPPAEAYSAYPKPAPMVEQSVPWLYTDVGRNKVQQVPPETANVTFQNVEPPPQSHGTVCYPVATDPYGQPPPPGFDYRVSLVPPYHYVSTWHPANPSYGNPSQFHNTVSPRQMHPVSYVTSPSPVSYYGPPSM
ncbi:putative bifunctional UDP-N-acetylglucosamine transferase and deubiquitinase ALG13 [Gopherus evgoodei]|uniref:putative bifunctional UDP-N-acetylglucosamine transferase and deubiquitinase ALG13 n=1 Tax=Gopherus evgoodei TaxID=1825980 RepID=UPI0011CF5CEA|nr:putative bifunctional UDP-N-acetylglucosamine transferase and deubiquitinase ALG13 [Gopherus evgoodei]